MRQLKCIICFCILICATLNCTKAETLDTTISPQKIDSVVQQFKFFYSKINKAEADDKVTIVTHSNFYNPETYTFGPLLKRVFMEKSECSGDSIYKYYYGNGILIEGELEKGTFFIHKFTTLKNGLKSGMNIDEVKTKLGTPRRVSTNILTYAVFDEIESEFSVKGKKYYYDGVRLLFEDGKLVALWFITKMTC